MRQENFQDFLRLLRHSYSGREIWLLLDEAPCHIAPRSQELAAALNIELIWLPKQCSELNAMDQLWRDLKNNVSANYQFLTLMSMPPGPKTGCSRSPGVRLYLTRVLG